MAGKPSVLLIDDGELDDFRAMLDQLGSSYESLTSREISGNLEHPDDLFITTASLGVRLQYQGGSHRKPKRPVRIAVGTGSTKTQRAALKRAGFDFLVHRPVHPSALRLLLMHSLYRGREKRQTTRYAFGYEVTYRVRFRRRKALLAELSADGCRLIAEQFPEPGTWTSVQIPAEVAGGKTLDLRGRVVRGDRRNQRGGKVTVGIQFERLDPSAEERLRAILVDRYWGPAMLPGRAPAAGPRRPIAAPPTSPVTEEAATSAVPEQEFDDSLMAGAPESIPTPEEVEFDYSLMADVSEAAPAPAPAPAPEEVEFDDFLMVETPETDPVPEEVELDDSLIAEASESAPTAEELEPQQTAPLDLEEPETEDRSAGDAPKRKNPRVSYGGEVIAMAEAVSRVLVGRDLSCEGMRVDPHPKLSLGDHVRLAIYSAGDDEPFIIGASVIRDDGEAGLALHFEEMNNESEDRLKDLLESLPLIETIGSPDGAGVVFSEVLDPES
jgi:hypothetical protein